MTFPKELTEAISDLTYAYLALKGEGEPGMMHRAYPQLTAEAVDRALQNVVRLVPIIGERS